MKQYFTGFFTAFCLTASAFMFMGSQNKNLGNIIVDSITVSSQNQLFRINENGLTIVGGDNEGVVINYEGIVVTDEGNKSFGVFNSEKVLLRKNNKPAVVIGIAPEGYGVIGTYNANGGLENSIGKGDFLSNPTQ